MRFSVKFLLQLTAVIAVYVWLWLQGIFIVGLFGAPYFFSACLVFRDIKRGNTEFSEAVCSSALFTLSGFLAFNVLPAVVYVGYVVAFKEATADSFFLVFLVSLVGAYVSMFAGGLFGLCYWFFLWLINYKSLRRSS